MTLVNQSRIFAFVIFIISSVAAYIYFDAKQSVELQRSSYINLNAISHGVFELNLLTSEHFSLHIKRSKAQWKRRHASLTNLILISIRKFEDKSVSKNLLLNARINLAKIRDLFFKILIVEKRQFNLENKKITTVITAAKNKNIKLIKTLRVQVILSSQQVISGVNRAGILSLKYLKQTEERANVTLKLFFASVFLILILIMVWVQRAFIRPIAKLKNYSDSLIAGNYHKKMVVKGTNEISRLSLSFNTLAATIAEKISDLTKQTISLDSNRQLLEVTNKELESYAYSISHDLRSPLRSIDGFSTVLMEDYADKLDDDGKMYLNKIRAGTKKMGVLITDLLKMSRITKQGIEIEDLDLAEIGKDEIKQLEIIFPNHKIEFTCVEHLKTRGDKALIQSVIENLLNNAVKYSQNKNPIKIELGLLKQDKGDVFYIKDNGVGFDMKYKSKLFKVFQRLHKVDQFEGTGVGLATVQRIIINHGGEIWAESEIDKGATFFFTLKPDAFKNKFETEISL